MFVDHSKKTKRGPALTPPQPCGGNIHRVHPRGRSPQVQKPPAWKWNEAEVLLSGLVPYFHINRAVARHAITRLTASTSMLGTVVRRHPWARPVRRWARRAHRPHLPHPRCRRRRGMAMEGLRNCDDDPSAAGWTGTNTGTIPRGRCEHRICSFGGCLRAVQMESGYGVDTSTHLARRGEMCPARCSGWSRERRFTPFGDNTAGQRAT
jgi:hypothetical protein